MKNILTVLLVLFTSLSYSQVLINDTFDAQGDWVLINGSTISGGVLNLVANGSVGSSQDNWSARQDNILNEHYYQTRRFRFTFDARQTSGTGALQLGQRNNSAFEQVITSSWVTYTVEADGNVANSENDIAFGGRNIGDTFEIDNFTMEIIGDTSNPNVPGEPAQVTFYTDFEFSRYGYDQWGAVGSPPAELNQWEVDSGEPRTTDHVDSPLSSGREGTGSAFWLGDYNSPTGFEFNRNEVGRDIALPFGEFWLGGSIFIQDSLPDARIIMQLRNLAPGGTSTVNAISLRQNTSTGQLYFSICDDVNFVDQTEVSLGYWNGAGTNTTSIPVDYNFRGWNDIAIHYKGAFGAAYTGPETSPSPDLETLTSLNEMAGYDMRSDGFIEIWFNGVKVVDHVGTTLYRYEKGGGQIRWGLTPKIGAYWGTPNAAQGNIYYDNWKIWNGPNGTYADVDPSGAGISEGNGKKIRARGGFLRINGSWLKIKNE